MKANKLISEKSPYLLQHAHNPVNWYPWGEEAFGKAKKENKPIFLSIGYSTCHWCHVMEQESFEDNEVARLMNENFISIKVDREERPDIDNVYMTVCQVVSGSGGWPLTVLMTPDKKPFFAGTYFPKITRYGRIGMMDLIPRLKDVWEGKQKEALESAEQITTLLKQVTANNSGETIDEPVMRNAYNKLLEQFDSENGGFGSAPKFPSPHNLTFLLRWWKRSGDKKALEMVEKTLQTIKQRGIYDHVGFGFHRYSTDSRWIVPHFEKMLYDQATLLIAYIEVYKITKNSEYKNVIDEICTYILRDMTSPDGGFYSAEDADSEGKEGKFYLWTYEELSQILSNNELKIVLDVFNVESTGNFLEEATREKTGNNILYTNKFISDSEIKLHLERIREKLYTVRKKRTRPCRDEKILTSWNGLMIAALSCASQALNKSEYGEAAKHAADFILSKMLINNKLLHQYCDSEVKVNGHLDDYAFFIWGLLELYETNFKVEYLKYALQLNEHLLKHFWDEKEGGFYFTGDYDEKLIVRQKESYDGAMPSGNSIAMLNLLRIGSIINNKDFKEKAIKIGEAFSANIKQSPVSYTQLLQAVDFMLSSSCEIVIVGDLQKDDTLSMLSTLRGEFIPSKVLLLKPAGHTVQEIAHLVESVDKYLSIDGKATAYVCHDYVCKSPTTNPSEMLKLLS